MRQQILRQVANSIVFGGWAVPALLARCAPERFGPDRGEQAARLFNMVAGGWAFLAVGYGVILAARMRRGLS